ncbi:MAG: TIGR04282 family arsenosugar biosynthesis glycosyltransferase [Deltaproteobacteria bacterium]|nr:TIGR04282 family arsenosugar biosynthesis glycosyltransferase [Deltaproteobacteria bacterium]
MRDQALRDSKQRTMRSRSTIIVFTREPLPGLSKTRLATRIGARNAAALAEAFTRDALAKVHELGVSVVIAGAASGPLHDNDYFLSLARRFDATLIDQGQGNLGVRMARVIARFTPGRVVLMGTDTPSLPVSAIRRGLALIRHNLVVLGPSLDGGYYLVGIRGAVPDMFRGIRWGGPRVLQQTVVRLAKFGIRPALAPAWYDIDRWDDLMLLTEHVRRLAYRHASPCPETTKVLTRLGLLQTYR